MTQPADIQLDGAAGPGLILCAGEALVDLISPPATDWASIDHFVPRIGGAPANTSVAIRRLGGRSAFLGCLSDDPPGHWIRSRLDAEGVDLSRAVSESGAPTRLAVVTGPIHERSFSFYGHPAADTLLTPDHIRSVSLEGTSAVIAGSLSLLAEPSRSAMRELLTRCAEMAIPLVFDPNPRPTSWPDPEVARREMIPFIRDATILKLGAGEPDILGLTIDEIRHEQSENAVLIVTDGPNGCTYWWGDQESIHLHPPAVKAVDSTGAGDAFTAAMTLRFVEQGMTLTHDALAFASAVGALTTTSQGAMEAIPTRAQLDEFTKRVSRGDGSDIARG